MNKNICKEFSESLLRSRSRIDSEEEFLNQLSSYEIPEVPTNLGFWMVRTKKGYFYHEFMRNKFVALAWNTIDQNTSFSKANIEQVKDKITMQYPEIKRPTTVINKCHNFMYQMKEGDILIIPSAKSQYITFALVGKYYEESSKTVELERAVISRIEAQSISISDVSCPYRKRRQVIPLRTVKSEELSPVLLRAISNYHGVSNLDDYAELILNQLLNCYTINNNINIVLNVKKSSAVHPRELGGLLYGTVDYFSEIIPESSISTQVALNSPGNIIIHLKDVYEVIKDNSWYFIGLFILIGGGSVKSFSFPGLPGIIKNFLTIREDVELKKLEARAKGLDADLKALEIEEKTIDIEAKKHKFQEKIKASNVNTDTLRKSIDLIEDSISTLEVEPIILLDEDSIYPDAAAFQENDTDDDL